MKRKITPEEYQALSEDDTLGYTPQYTGYKTKKVREYSECGECGHREFIGWVERTYPIGEPISYVYYKPSAVQRAQYELQKYYRDELLPQMTVNYAPSGESKKITFIRYGDMPGDNK